MEGLSPDSEVLERTRKSKGIASRIGAKSTRSKLGGKRTKVQPVMIDIEGSHSDTSLGENANKALVPHEGFFTSDVDAYLFDVRVSSKEYGDDDEVVEETQAIVEARGVDQQLMKNLGRRLGMSKSEVNRGTIKEAIDNAVTGLEEEGMVFESGENFLGETEEEKMMNDGKFGWSDEESGFEEGSYDDEE